jgi:hypothetical protein
VELVLLEKGPEEFDGAQLHPIVPRGVLGRRSQPDETEFWPPRNRKGSPGSVVVESRAVRFWINQCLSAHIQRTLNNPRFQKPSANCEVSRVGAHFAEICVVGRLFRARTDPD